ncbi:hypothetical protein ACIBCM_19370 [Streptomyces sp. NPDC051018]|uniref:hypothetical protein n=1 Tax=Streptomyces sp. NPDC051018 TaxID=3365639 RepID=UPI0037946997
MTSQTGGGHPYDTLHDRISELLRDRNPLDRHALLATLDAEVTARETSAYTAGWNDALTEIRHRLA